MLQRAHSEREMRRDASAFNMRCSIHDLNEMDNEEMEEEEIENLLEVVDTSDSPPVLLNVVFQQVAEGSTELIDLSLDVHPDESFGSIKLRLQFSSAKLLLPQKEIWLEDADTPSSVGLHDGYNHVAVINPEVEIMLKLNTAFQGSLNLRFHIDTCLQLALQAAIVEFCRPLKIMEEVYATDSLSGNWSLEKLLLVDVSSTPRELGWCNGDHYCTHEVELRSPNYEFP